MRSISLGVVKRFLKAWSFITFEMKPWRIGNSINILNEI